MLKHKCLLLAALTTCVTAASADVVPGKDGVYIGVITATMNGFSVAQGQKIKENIIMFVAPDGHFVIEGETVEITGTMNASTYHGAGLITNGSGLMPLHFGSNGTAKGTVTMGLLVPGSTDGLSIEGKVKFRKTQPAEVK